ncbi:hypothetical protein RFI_14647 [Reticulomyxa filosa]|uniref:ceramidase n=1 Tax=Reticulomyxa filosa TaxID=46433 RepID=X6N9W9_RETFI|nr:hypothetical protein RFI_14647 [Reticulomyxa filosa]|eukprot:ETO22544.1 hypothetical protein RFI_14647 [Reticulomyxa filosa]
MKDKKKYFKIPLYILNNINILMMAEPEEKTSSDLEEKKEVVVEESGTSVHVTKVPLFTVALDADPSVRWKEIITAYKVNKIMAEQCNTHQIQINSYEYIQHIQKDFERVRKVINQFVENEGGKTGEILKSIITGTLKQFKWMRYLACQLVKFLFFIYVHIYINNKQDFFKKMKGELIMMQLIYEATALCTSIVTIDRKNESKPIHIRTMDWEMEFLQPLTIEIQFTLQNQVICHCTTWAGYVGILTGLYFNHSESSKSFECVSVSVNFRVTGTGYWTNLKKTLSGSWPIGFKLRDLLTTPHQSFDSVVSSLKTAEFIAPVYFTIAGSRLGQAIIITRDRTEHEQPYSFTDETPFIVQTNIGLQIFIYIAYLLILYNFYHWSNKQEDDIMWSISRRRNVKKQLLQLLEQNKLGVNSDELWDLISMPPIFNDITVYGTLMIPSLGYLETRIPHPQLGFKPVSQKFAQDSEKLIWKTCTKCNTRVHVSLNVKGECVHSGEWHDDYDKCSTVKCGWNLGLSKIGKCHWSCCFNTNFDSFCVKSDFHIVSD